jgi:hypothetical protein
MIFSRCYLEVMHKTVKLKLFVKNKEVKKGT